MVIQKLDAANQKELKKVEAQIEKSQESMKEVGKEILNTSPKNDVAPPEVSSKISSPEIYLKPKRTIQSKDKFNEALRSKYEHDKELVRFIAENNEIRGEPIEIWTRPYGGLPAEMWSVPVNKAVWGPRYLAEQIKRKFYNRLIMEDKPISSESGMTYYGSMAVESTIHRLNAHPAKVAKQVSFYQEASNF